jgi:hypothetical protein
MKWLALTLLPFVLPGCTVTHIQSNKDPGFTKKIQVLHIVLRGSASTDVLIYTMGDNLRDELNKKGIKTTVERVNALSLETDKEFSERISKLNPDALLMINQTEARKRAGGYSYSIGSYNAGATFDLKLFQPGSEKPVWRANISIDSQGEGAAGKKSAAKIIEKMTTDQLIL